MNLGMYSYYMVLCDATSRSYTFPDTEILKMNVQYLHDVWHGDEMSLFQFIKPVPNGVIRENVENSRSGVVRQVLIEGHGVVGEGHNLRGHRSLWRKYSF